MREIIKLTRGAYRLLRRRYKAILINCALAALCLARPLAAADAVPAPGSSFTVDSDMTLNGLGDVAYGDIHGANDSPFIFTLDDTRIRAKDVHLEQIKVEMLNNSSLAASGTLSVGQTSMENSALSAAGRISLPAMVNVAGGENTISSKNDIIMAYGTSLENGASLSLLAERDIEAGFFSAINASNLATKSLSAWNLSLKNGFFELTGSSSVGGKLVLDEMQSSVGNLSVSGTATVSGGEFTAQNAKFNGGATFSNVDADISSLAATDFTAVKGSLVLGADAGKTSTISGDFTLNNVKSTLGSLNVQGKTAISGGTLEAKSLTLGETLFSNVSPQIENLALAGPLTLDKGAVLKTDAAAIGANQLAITGKSALTLEGDFQTAALTMNQGTLSVDGALKVDMQGFNLAASQIMANTVSMGDVTASGDNRMEAQTIALENLALTSGRTVLLADEDITAGDISLRAGSNLSLQGAPTRVASIAGSGSLDAHNLNVAGNLSLTGGNNSASNTFGGSLNLTGDNSVGGDLKLNLINASVENLAVEGAAMLNASTLTGGKLTLSQGGSLDNTSRIEVQSLEAAKDITLEGSAQLLAGEIALKDANLTLDGGGGSLVAVAVGAFREGDLTVEANSLLSIGAATPNWVNMGMSAHNATAALGLWEKFKLGAGSYAAVGAGMARLTAPRANQINFGANSLLITNASVADRNGEGAIHAVEPAVANVADGARLHLLNVQKDGLYRVLGENITVNYEGNAWQGDNLGTDSVLVKLERLGGDMLGWFQAKTPGASTVLPGLDPDLGGSVDDANNKGQITPEPDSVPRPPQTTRPPALLPEGPGALPDSPARPDNPGTSETPGTPETPENPGVPESPDTPAVPDNPENPGDEPDMPDTPSGTPETPPETPPEAGQPTLVRPNYTQGQLFLSRATNFWFIGHDERLAARTIESAARIFALGAVPEMTMAANQAAAAIMGQRTGANSGIQAMNALGETPGGDWHGFSLWIAPLYKSVNGFSLTSGSWDTDINGNLGGVAIGADYTFANALRLGLSLNIGGGYATGGGDLADTANNMSFWGLGAYGGWKLENFQVNADVAFTSTYNKLEQELPGGMRMDNLKSDITAWALSAGLELGYVLPLDWLDIRAHAGARYTYLHNDAYDVNSGGTVLEGKAKGQNIWTFPVGLGLEKEFVFDSGWHLRPMLDFSVIPAAGDKKARSEVKFTGTDAWATMKDQFMDDVSWRGALGVEFGAGDFSLGLNYSLQAGMKTSSHSVYGTFAYTF